MSDTARSIVTKRIAAQYKRFPDIEPKPLLVDGLDTRDASLARAIDHAVHRRWISLTTVLNNAMDREVRRLDGPIGGVLLVASAQLLLLDRIPDHAVINDAVEWVKRQGNVRVAGFVNAVLRTITRQRGNVVEIGELGNPCHFLRSNGSAWELHDPVFLNEPALQCGFEPKVWKRLQEQVGEERTNEIGLNSLSEAPCILAMEQGSTEPMHSTPHQSKNNYVLDRGANIGEILEENPKARIQDPTSTNSLELAALLRPRRILDVCAGRGTKTKQLRSMFPDAMIGATEPNEERRKVLSEIAGDLDVEVYSQETDGPSEPFDLIVVDTPCSNSGVFARRPEAKYRYKEKQIESLVALQREILSESCQVLRRQGHLLYATCSIDQEENQSQVNWLKLNKGFSCIDMKETFPNGAPSGDPTQWHDGGFAALLQGT